MQTLYLAFVAGSWCDGKLDLTGVGAVGWTLDSMMVTMSSQLSTRDVCLYRITLLLRRRRFWIHIRLCFRLIQQHRHVRRACKCPAFSLCSTLQACSSHHDVDAQTHFNPSVPRKKSHGY